MGKAHLTDTIEVPAPISTIYTKLGDTFASVAQLGDISAIDIRAMNPHVRELAELEAGIPLDLPFIKRRSRSGTAATAGGRSAYDIAKREKSLGVSEVSAPGEDNPRIRVYHATTHGGAMPDEVSWCSSYVNYCVEEAGGRGTDSKAARSWLTWGHDVPRNDWQEGDIVVFWRESPDSWKGHVAFLVNWDGERPFVLGGNQGNRISVDDPYPFRQILSIRRG
ncbi:TIGR02594 family protein [Rhizobium ruizarguesonis]|uniref:TIGR02594 family protein n=1 Tax=Rhizobium ruizarguesonis TaxID=2081791 RepID=UPI00102F984F|nr:TIGR02594 family protein [Rhizobium ruizarguesonis]TBD12785.1 TIGR02594 family protein [Rhizobium ruizarguesonis]